MTTVKRKKDLVDNQGQEEEGMQALCNVHKSFL